MEFQGHKGLRTRGFLWINLGFSFFSCCLIYMRNIKKLKLQKMEGEAEMSESVCSGSRFTSMIFEFILLFMQPYPFLVNKKHYVYNKLVDADIYYNWNDYLHLISLSKFIYLISAFLNTTKWKSSSADRIW